MRNFIRAWIISTAISTIPLNVDGNSFGKNQDMIEKQTNTKLSMALNSENGKKMVEICIEPRIISKAILDYFDEEVKLYKLTPEAKTKIENVLNSYFGAHNVFHMDDDWRMRFVIDNKKEFALMAKKVMNIVIWDMPFFVRKVIIPLFLWWNDEIQKKLDNLDETMMNMKEKQYKLMMLDYVVWIVRRVEESVDWKITIWDYYRDISRYYPNKEWKKILKELNNSGQVDLNSIIRLIFGWIINIKSLK